MENKKAAILVLAVAAALVLAVSATYAMMGRGVPSTGNSYPNAAYRSDVGPSVMGGSVGYRGGVMGGHGMMGAEYGPSSMMGDMQQYMWHYWNSSAVP